MSRLKVDNIEPRSGNNVAIDNPMNLKSYTTAQRDALTSVAGDMIYNSDDNKPQFYNGSSWTDFTPATFETTSLVIAGGGGGGVQNGAGGGAGGYRNSYSSDTYSGRNGAIERTVTTIKGTSYTVTVGSGGAAGSTGKGGDGNNSVFAVVTSIGGGGGARSDSSSNRDGNDGGAGGGGASSGTTIGNKGLGTNGQGFDGGIGATDNTTYRYAGGGGGAGSGGSNANSGGAGGGGAGLSSSITGSAVTRGVGGAGGVGSSSPGAANTGNGGGGGIFSPSAGSAGGSGIVILRYPTADATISVGAGLTSSSATDGSDTVVTFTAGTGTVSFS